MAYLFLCFGTIFLVLFLVLRDKNGSILAIVFKILTSLMFIFTAIFAIYKKNSFNIEAILILIGLIFGLIGDILLDFKVYFKALNVKYNVDIKDNDNLLYSGMASFGIGHIMFILSAYLLSNNLWINLIISLIISAILIFIIMIISIKVLKMNYNKFLTPSICYGFLLCGFFVFSIFKIIDHYSTMNLLMLIGSILFLLSDLVLSMTYFSKEEDYKKDGLLNPESRLMISINHILYYGAQFIIALSILFL